MRLGIVGFTLLGLFSAGGCVERTLSVASDPPGALVYLNDQEIGRTPLEHDFLWYGKYDVILRKDGYESVKTQANVKPPLYQIPPLDLLAELLPFWIKDHQSFQYSMQANSQGSDDAQKLVQRAENLRGDLQSSRVAPPATRPR